MSKHRPCPVVESPRIIEVDLQRLQERFHPACKFRIARGRVLYLVKLSREATEIVNRPRRRADCDASFGYKPMRGLTEWLSALAFVSPCAANPRCSCCS
jgi:hypothetical protein